MQSGDGGLAGNYIHREHLQDEFESYLKERYSQTPANAKVIAEAMIQQFRERNFILSLYGANLYGFVHRAFLEYFCASAFVWKFEKTKELTIEQLKTDVYGKHWEDQSWHEVLRLICGMVDEKWVGRIIEYLAVEIYRPWPEKFGKRQPWNIVLAVKCLNETRNLAMIALNAKTLLEILCSLFDHALNNDYDMADFLKKQILPEVKSIGSNWPYRDLLIEWLGQTKPVGWAIICYEPFGDFVGMVGNGSKEIYQAVLRYATHRQKIEYRMLSMFALACGWHDEPQTFTILKDCATNRDNHPWVREAGISALQKHFAGDPQILPLLKQCVDQGNPERVRQIAIKALAERFPYDTDTLPLLLECAQRDSLVIARVAAVEALSDYFRDDSNTLPLLLDRASNDEYTPDEDRFYECVRVKAVQKLAEYYSTEPTAIELLHNRAICDTYEWVRETATWGLGQFAHNDNRTLHLLRDRALNDPSPIVRCGALGAISEYYQNEADTFNFLCNCAVTDESPRSKKQKQLFNVRETAIDAIASHWAAHPETLPFLRERAQIDPTPWLRKRAKKLADAIKQGKPIDEIEDEEIEEE
jgi:hypothetical protein